MTPLNEVATISFGTRVTKKRDSGTLYPVYGGGGATFALDEFNRENCFIVSRFGMSEECVRFVRGKFFLNDSGLTASTLDEDRLHQRFLDTYLVSKQPEIYELGRGTAQKNLNVSAFREMFVPLPPLDEQKRIVAVLDQAFTALDRARAHAEANLVDAAELFSNYLADVFSRGGDGWSECCVGDVITLQRGFDITKKEQRDGDIPVFSSGGSKSLHTEAKAKAPGVVVGRKGSIGSVYYAEKDFWPHDTTLFVKDFKGNCPLLVFFLLKGLRLAELDTGAANPSLNRNLVHPMTIMWPDVAMQGVVANGLRKFEASTNVLQSRYVRKLADLANLRQSLLQKAFSGQLT